MHVRSDGATATMAAELQVRVGGLTRCIDGLMDGWLVGWLAGLLVVGWLVGWRLGATDSMGTELLL